jgi:predicted dehydrogenase
VRWGIASTGGIAHGFALAPARLPDAEIVAVASRTSDAADAIARMLDRAREQIGLRYPGA